MADDRIEKYLVDDEFRRAPEPYGYLIASPVFSPIWGRGWLGYTTVRDAIDLWYVEGDLSASFRLDYAELMAFNDKALSRLWLIAGSVRMWRTPREGPAETTEARYGSVVFLLNPPEDLVLFPIPRRLNQFLENYHG